MRKHVFFILFSLFCFLSAVAGLIYVNCYPYQSRVGPIGDGSVSPGLREYIPIFCLFLLSVTSLLQAIVQYRKKIKKEKNKKSIKSEQNKNIKLTKESKKVE